MARRSAADVLVAIEQRLDSAHSLLAELHAELVEKKKVGGSVPQPIDDSVSARIQLGGFETSVSREFWEKHGSKIKIVSLGGLSWAAGWLAKLLHTLMQQ